MLLCIFQCSSIVHITYIQLYLLGKLKAEDNKVHMNTYERIMKLYTSITVHVEYIARQIITTISNSNVAPVVI